MDKNQINRKERNEDIIIYLDTHVQKWSSISKVGEFKNEFESINSQIEESQEAQQEAKVYVGKNKKQLKKTIADKADIINDLVETFALVDNNPELESMMAASASELFMLRNEDFIVRIKEIISQAENHKKTLKKEYGLTDAQIIDLQTDMNSFQKLLGKPRAYQISSTQATQDLDYLFKESNRVLTQKLDKVMKIFKRRDANFYNGYLAAREIVDN